MKTVIIKGAHGIATKINACDFDGKKHTLFGAKQKMIKSEGSKKSKPAQSKG